MNRHERNIEAIVAENKSMWEQGFIKDEPDWSAYEAKLRAHLLTCSAAEITELRHLLAPFNDPRRRGY